MLVCIHGLYMPPVCVLLSVVKSWVKSHASHRSAIEVGDVVRGMNLRFVCVSLKILVRSVSLHVLPFTSAEPGFHVGDQTDSLSESQLVHSV